MRVVEQKIQNASYCCDIYNPVIKINSQCRVYFTDDDEVCLEYYPAGGVICKFQRGGNAPVTYIIYQRGYKGKLFSDTEMSYIRAFTGFDKDEFNCRGGQINIASHKSDFVEIVKK